MLNSSQYKLEHLAAVEPVLNNFGNISNDEKSNSRQSITIAGNSAPKTNNLAVNEKRPSLKNDNSIVIVPADGGRSTVAIEKSDYDAKIDNHLSDQDAYTKIDINLPNALTNKVSSELKQQKTKRA